MPVPHTFATQGGNVSAVQLDDNFNACAMATDLTTLDNEVAALPSSTVPLKPTAGGSAGAAATLSKYDHQHPPQQADQNAQSGTTYTLLTTDDGKVVEITNAAAITLTLPASLPTGFSCLVCQGGAGAITFSAGSGATINQRQSYTKTAGQWAVVSLYVRSNNGGLTAATYVVAGDMAA